MTSEPVQVEVDTKAAGPDFWVRYHAYRRALQAESRPDDPIRPDELEQMRMQRDDPFDIPYRYEIASGGHMLSWFGAETIRPGAPGYDANKHLFSASWSVHPAHRRQGIGRSWLPLVVELMERHGCTVLTAGSDQDSGRAFMKWLGAEAKLTETENRLELGKVDWAMVRKWVAEGKRRSPGTRVETYDDGMPESMWDDYTKQLTSLLNTMPFERLDHGPILVTPEHMREWYGQMQIDSTRHHVVLAREKDGVISGTTELIWAPHRRKLIHQMFTGVRPDARGRGLGKWLKAAMLEHVRDLYPDAEWISTDNAGSNVPMLAINKKLGFKHHRTETVYQIGRERLAQRIKELAPSV